MAQQGTFELTEEQEKAREVFAVGRDLALIAGAGTGKTTTLALMASVMRRRGLYADRLKSSARIPALQTALIRGITYICSPEWSQAARQAHTRKPWRQPRTIRSRERR